MEVTTRADHPDRGLRGRRYALPFDRVWGALMGLASELRLGVHAADDQWGRLEASQRSLLGLRSRLVVDVGLDTAGQTRVDVRWNDEGAAGIVPGRARRSVKRLLRRLDRALGTSPGDRLDPGGARRALPVSPPAPPAPSPGA